MYFVSCMAASSLLCCKVFLCPGTVQGEVIVDLGYVLISVLRCSVYNQITIVTVINGLQHGHC